MYFNLCGGGGVEYLLFPEQILSEDFIHLIVVILKDWFCNI